MKASIFLRSAGLGAALLFAGACAHRQDLVKPESAPGAPSATDPAPQDAAASADAHLHYVVRKGDSLWKIASQASVLGDAFEWPLLYRLNRDEIQDPDLIYPRQDLSYRKTFDPADVRDALREASLTPAYVAHKKPRKVLPLQY